MRAIALVLLAACPAQAGRRYCYNPCIKYHEPVYQKLYEPVVEPLGEPVYQQAVLPQEQTVYAYGDAVVKVGPEVDIEAATFRLLRTHEAYVSQVPEITAQMTGMIQSLAAARVEATYKITSESGQASTLGEAVQATEVQSLTEKNCASCHTGPDKQGGFDIDHALDYDAAFEEVLSGRMPKSKEISADERLELLRFFKGE